MSFQDEINKLDVKARADVVHALYEGGAFINAAGNVVETWANVIRAHWVWLGVFFLGGFIVGTAVL